MTSVLHIVCSCIFSLRCFFLLIRIGFVAIVALIPADITGSQVKSTMPLVLHILHWSVIGLQGFFLLIRIRFRIVAIRALRPVYITSSMVKPLEVSCGLSLPAGGGDVITLIDFVTFSPRIPAAPCHREMQFVSSVIVVHRDCWVSVSDIRLLKRPLGGQIVEKNCIEYRRCFSADDHGRRWVLRLLDPTVDCGKSGFLHPLFVALR